MKRGDIYYFKLKSTGLHVQGGIRPCVIIQNDKGNAFSPNTIVAPITSKHKRNLPTHITLPKECKIKGTVLCEAIVTVSKNSAMDSRCVCTLNDEEMNEIDKAIKYSLQV